MMNGKPFRYTFCICSHLALMLLGGVAALRRLAFRPYCSVASSGGDFPADCSVIRWGDGETSLLLGKDIWYQKWSAPLAIELLDILVKHGRRRNLILCFPRFLFRTDYFAGCGFRNIRIWWKSFLLISLFSRSGARYGDALMFRREDPFFAEHLTNLLIKAHNIAIVSSSAHDVSVLADIVPQVPMSHIACPHENAFAVVDELMALIRKTVARIGTTEGFIVCLAAGPASKVLAWRLHSEGVRSLDVGHFFQHYSCKQGIER